MNNHFSRGIAASMRALPFRKLPHLTGGIALHTGFALSSTGSWFMLPPSMRAAAEDAAHTGHEAAFAVFMDISARLTENTNLDPRLGWKLFHDILAEDVAFVSKLKDLAAHMDSLPPSAMTPRTFPEDSRVPWSGVPRAILSGWHLGLGNDHVECRAVIYGQILMHRLVFHE